MKCDNCKKNDATVHLTEIINDKVTKMHLCEQCAKEKSEEMEEHFGISDLLAGMADFGQQPDIKGGVDIKCSECGLSLADFQKTGRLGCPNCYTRFENELSPLIKRIHGSDVHIGKLCVPHAKAEETLIDKEVSALHELRIKMQKAVSAEAFEEAAALRDKIKELENKLKLGNNDGNKQSAL